MVRAIEGGNRLNLTIDEWCFVIRDARPLPFIPLRGALGFFWVSPDVIGRVREHLAATEAS